MASRIVKRLAGLLFLCTASVSLAVAGVAHTQKAETSKKNSPLGDWRGMSVCQVKPSGCHDEDSLYHVRQRRTKGGEFELQADKVVDGKRVTMGAGPCDLDVSGQLVCAVPGGASLRFHVHGDQMNGVMRMADGTVWRKITLKRVRQD